MSCGYAVKNSFGVVIGHVLHWIPAKARTKVSGTTYGGEYYQQTVGTPGDRAKVNIYVSNQAELSAVNTAEAVGELLTVDRSGVRYSVYIDSQPSWSAIIPGRIYECDCVFIIQSSEAIT